jgi:hypothetical protein
MVAQCMRRFGLLRLEDSAGAYPTDFPRKPLNPNVSQKFNPTELQRAYTGPALIREDFEELRTFEM